MVLKCSKCNKELEKPRVRAKLGYAVCLECKKTLQRENIKNKKSKVKSCKKCGVFLGGKMWLIRIGYKYYCRECYLDSQLKETTIEWCEKQAKFYEKRLYKLT